MTKDEMEYANTMMDMIGETIHHYKAVIDDLYDIQDQMLAEATIALDNNNSKAAKRRFDAIYNIQDTINNINLLYLDDALTTYPAESISIITQVDEDGKHYCYLSPKTK